MSNKSEFLSSTTSDKGRYITIWENHVNELERIGTALLCASKTNELYDELHKIQSRLNQLIQIAANEDFK